MRRLVFYGVLAATAAVLAVSCSSSPTEEVRSAAQPPDNPSDTAPGRPTSTTEPDAGPTVQQVGLKGRFGEACSDEGLCYEVSKYSNTTTVCDLGPCVDFVDPPGMYPGSQPVFQTAISFAGETMRLVTVLGCEVGTDRLIYGAGGGGSPDDHGHFTFYGGLPIGTPPLEIDGVTIHQLEVVSGSGEPLVQVYVTEPVDIGHHDDEDEANAAAFSVEQKIFSEREPFDEFEANLGRPLVRDTCTEQDYGLPPFEEDSQ